MKFAVKARITFSDRTKDAVVTDNNIESGTFEDLLAKIKQLYPCYKYEHTWNDNLVEINVENYLQCGAFFAFFKCLDLVSIVNCTLRSRYGLEQESQEKGITHNSLLDLRNQVQNIYSNGSDLRLLLLADGASMPLDDVCYNTLSSNAYIVAVFLYRQITTNVHLCGMYEGPDAPIMNLGTQRISHSNWTELNEKILESVHASTEIIRIEQPNIAGAVIPITTEHIYWTMDPAADLTVTVRMKSPSGEIGSRLPALERLSGRLDQLLKFA